jgi:hypothetical protein
MSQATIIISAQKPVALLKTAIECAQAQTIKDLEIVCISDSPAASDVITELAKADKRISLSVVPEGLSFEQHRHNIVLQAKSEAVCYLNSCTLALPGHVAYLLDLLKESDLAHVLPLAVQPGHLFATGAVDLALPMYRELVLSGNSRVPLSSLGHRAETYRTLKIDWSTLKESENAFLLRYFIDAKIKVMSGKLPTVLLFSEKTRKEWSEDQWTQEAAYWKNEMEKPEFVEELYKKTLETVVQERAALEQHFDAMNKATAKMHADYQVVHKDLKWLVKEHKRLEEEHQRMSQENSFLQADLAEIKNKD